MFADYEVSPGALDTSIYAVFPYNRHLSPKVRAMVDFFVERFGRPRTGTSAPPREPQPRLPGAARTRLAGQEVCR